MLSFTNGQNPSNCVDAILASSKTDCGLHQNVENQREEEHGWRFYVFSAKYSAQGTLRSPGANTTPPALRYHDENIMIVRHNMTWIVFLSQSRVCASMKIKTDATLDQDCVLKATVEVCTACMVVSLLAPCMNFNTLRADCTI